MKEFTLSKIPGLDQDLWKLLMEELIFGEFAVSVFQKTNSFFAVFKGLTIFYGFHWLEESLF